MDLFSQIKKSVASVAFVAMAMTVLAPVAGAMLPYTDAAEIPSWAEEAIEELMDQGVLSGNDDGSFAPNRQLNRAEVSKIIVLASGVDFDTTGGPHFPDVAADAWYYDYVETMYNYGWINGYPDGLFRPGVGINRVEVAKMVVNAFEIDQDLAGAPHFGDVTDSDWFYGYVETAYNNGLMRGYGDGTFGPSNAVTRAETAHITYNSQLVVAPVMGPAEGTLEVTLSDMTPRGTNVPYNSTSVPYLTVEVTASDDSDVEISSMTYTRLGLGDNDDFDNVWLEIDGFKVGNDKSVNNDDIVELRFNPPVVVPAGQTLIADVVASAKYTSTDKNVGHHSRFALVSADDVASSAINVVGDFPIEGEEMEVADYEVSTLTFTSLGSNTTVDVGDNFIEIGKFRLLNGSNTNKDVELRAVTFKNDGTAELEDNLENVALYVSGEQVSAESIIDGDYLTFRLDNGVTGGYVIEDGDSKIFSLRADIVSAEASDTIVFKVDNYEDVVGVEIGTSFGVKALTGNTSVSTCTATSNAEDACATLSTYTIDSGDLNVSRDPSSLGNQEYSAGSNDVVALTARLVVDQPLLVDGIYIDVASGSTVALNPGSVTCAADSMVCFNTVFDNFRLFLNDQLVDTENDFTLRTGSDGTVTNYTLNFNTTFEIAGTSILKVVMNVSDSAVTGDKLKLEIASADFQSPEYISTGDQVAAAGLLGSATGSFVNVQQSIITVTETSGLSNGDKLVAGVDDVTFVELTLDNNDSGDVNVTSMTVGVETAANTTNAGTGISGSTRTYTNFTLAVFVDGTQQGSAKNLNSSGKATFNDLSVVIPSAGQKEFVVVVDTIEASSTAISTVVNDGTIANAETVITVTSSAGMTVGDILAISETTSTSTTYHAITVITNNVTDACSDGSTDTCDTLTIGDALATATLPITTDVVTIKHQIKLDLEDVDADNVENGQTVTVTDDGSTAIAVTTNEVAGTMFELVTSGTLTASLDSTVASDLLVAGSSNVELLKIRFNAANDEVQIKDLYLDNDIGNDGTITAGTDTDIGDRVDFKLYNEAGQLIQEKIMSGGYLHFELANADRIRVPKDDSTFVTVKADIRDITKANQTGKRMQLNLNDSGAAGTYYRGIQAVTAATGDDITVPTVSPYWGAAVGQDFVAYNTALTIAPAATQPSMNLPSLASTEFYRFTVTADSADNAEIGHVTMDLSMNGINFVDVSTDFTSQKVVNGSPDSNQVFGTEQTTVVATDDTAVRIVVDLDGERLSAGESRTFAVFASNTEEAGTAENSDGVTVTLVRDTTYAAPGTKANAGVATYTIASTTTVPTAISAGSVDVNGTTVSLILADFTEADTNDGVAAEIATLITAAAISGVTATSSGAVVTVTGADTFVETIDVVLTGPSDETSVVAITGIDLATWSDESDPSHSDTTSDWLNGYLLDVDTNGKRLTK
jgi:hypothetical protein